MYSRLLFILIISAAVLYSCSSPGNLGKSDDLVNPDEVMSNERALDNPAYNDSTRWGELVEEGELGKADFITGELKNIDYWPFPINQDEVFQEVVWGNPYRYGTCAQYIETRKENYKLQVRFVIDTRGATHNILFLNKTGPCREKFLPLFKKIRFTPGQRDSVRVPTLITYSVNTNYRYRDN